jgi:ABC-type transport system involved in cytochrome bd biosynthesis fused ATPase/permease subunit
MKKVFPFTRTVAWFVTLHTVIVVLSIFVMSYSGALAVKLLLPIAAILLSMLHTTSTIARKAKAELECRAKELSQSTADMVKLSTELILRAQKINEQIALVNEYSTTINDLVTLIGTENDKTVLQEGATDENSKH